MNKNNQQELAESVLKIAKKKGATASAIRLNFGSGLAVDVRDTTVDRLEYYRDQGLSITTYFGQKTGQATTGDLSKTAIEDTIDAACRIAKYTSEDPYSGLADSELLATDIQDLDLYHPWDINAEKAIELATACEQVARNLDKRIINTEGSGLTTYSSCNLYANSNQFMGITESSRHYINCAVIGEENGNMQRDSWYTLSRRAELLKPVEYIAKKAVKKTLRRFNSQSLKTQEAPVLFAPNLARGLISHFTSAISGASQYRKASFLLDSLGNQVFPDFIHLYEQPHIPQALKSAYYDQEGVATKNKDIVKNGQIETYLLGSYSARKLGMQSTANAGGTYNLTLDDTGQNFDDLLKLMGTGLLVTELIGSGANIVTGDYSRGAVGFWVENGEIQYPVEEITIAGHLKNMLRGIVAVGNDVDSRSAMQTGSILLDKMMIAGK